MMKSLLCFFCSLSIFAHIIGVRVSDATSEMSMMIHIIQPSCLKSTPAIPVTIVNGKNTANIVNVDAITDTPTSLVPWIAAFCGLEPRSMCVVTFSSTTMASSTTEPMAILRHESEIMLIEPSVTNR